VPRHFSYGSRPHHGDRTLHRHGFPAAESYTLFELRHLDGPHFLVVIFIPLVQMVMCKRLSRLLLIAWLSARFLRFISLTLALSHLPFLMLCR
jgi:hypothetical protein